MSLRSGADGGDACCHVRRLTARDLNPGHWSQWEILSHEHFAVIFKPKNPFKKVRSYLQNRNRPQTYGYRRGREGWIRNGDEQTRMSRIKQATSEDLLRSPGSPLSLSPQPTGRRTWKRRGRYTYPESPRRIPETDVALDISLAAVQVKGNK